MAGPRYLGVSNVIDPTEGARRALNEAGSIYRDFDEQTRRNEDRQRVIAEHDRLNQERQTLAGYNPTVGQDFFGVDADTQNHIRQNESQAVQRNAEALARKDPKALTEEALQQDFIAKRAQLADRDTVFRSVYSDLVSQGVSEENAQRRATVLSSGYGSTRDLAAAEQAAVEARNKQMIEYAKIQAKYDQSFDSDRTALLRTGLNAGTESQTVRTGGSSGTVNNKGYVPYGADALPDLDAINKEIASGEGLVGSGDTKRGINALVPAYRQLVLDADEQNEARYQDAVRRGIDPKTVPMVQVPSWDSVRREYATSFQPGIDNRFAFNTPGEARVGLLEPLQARLQRGYDIQFSGTAGTGVGGRNGTSTTTTRRLGDSIGLDEALEMQTRRTVALQQPAVARQLTDINRARVAQVYGQFVEANPQVAVARSRESIATTNAPAASVAQTQPAASAPVTPQITRPLGSDTRPPASIARPTGSIEDRIVQGRAGIIARLPETVDMAFGVPARAVSNAVGNTVRDSSQSIVNRVLAARDYAAAQSGYNSYSINRQLPDTSIPIPVLEKWLPYVEDPDRRRQLEQAIAAQRGN